ncbi:MAG: NAD(P)H-dependent oxidoreductase [Bryobacterales bacterium]|nr:NAD(P)H-dependent oxidoreductase [Bryobacterales bacterium]
MKQLAISLLLCASAAAAAPPIRILVAYHSQTGNTEKLAMAVRDGAASVPEVEVALRKVGQATAEDIVKADGLAVGTPVHWGNLSAETKSFLDRVGAALGLGKQGATFGEGRLAGVFCTAGGPAGGQDTARLSIIASLLHLRFVVAGGVSADGFGELGPQAATMGTPGGVGKSDLDDARRFGERLARLTKQFRSGVGK